MLHPTRKPAFRAGLRRDPLPVQEGVKLSAPQVLQPTRKPASDAGSRRAPLLVGEEVVCSDRTAVISKAPFERPEICLGGRWDAREPGNPVLISGRG